MLCHLFSFFKFKLQESVDNRGHQADTEVAAYEIRLFCEMLLKGAVNIFEVRVVNISLHE